MKDIDIQEIFENRHLQELEFEILDLDNMAEKELYSGSGCNSAKVAIRKLLLVRKRLLDSMFVMTDEYKRLLGEFNDALSAKLLDVRKKSVLMYESLNALNMGGSLSVHGKCFLGYEYYTVILPDMWVVLVQYKVTLFDGSDQVTPLASV